MKRLLYILTAALMASACGEEKNEVFYTISYPITEVGAEVTIETTEPEPEPTPGEGGETGGSDTTGGTGTDEGTGSGSGTEDETGDGTGEGGQTEDPAVAAGRLEVMTAVDAALAAGVFGKEPGQSSIEFIYSGRDYVGTVSSYTDSEGVRKVLLAVDLTEEYRKLHPEVNITKAERLEYTSTNAY